IKLRKFRSFYFIKLINIIDKIKISRLVFSGQYLQKDLKKKKPPQYTPVAYSILKSMLFF
ncbi:MAG TPA: hypothetical protein VLM39_03590, partial [Ignavibacteriaceae bacterium]|nr:hypothetical protein [Ignavibacteriaceae bacterium]